ncbi:MAG: NAD(P)H-hydrate dehydratase [bacterium]
MIITTNDIATISSHLRQIHTPQSNSHKGQNGKVLVIGGSSLFHGAVLWAAEAASHIVDMVHVASTSENNDIIKKIKTIWQTGMVIAQHEIPQYVNEDNVILIGNGMMRGKKIQVPNFPPKEKKWEEVLGTKEEGEFTRELVYYLITHFPDKQFVLDAGALQMMDAKWLPLLHKQAIITPHQKEFQSLFDVDLSSLTLAEKEKLVAHTARTYSCIILLKAVDDIISDGKKTLCIRGGNAGLTKGGTGDILAGLVSGMSATSDPYSSSVVASFLLKKTAEGLFNLKGYWYTPKDLITLFPSLFHSLTKGSGSLT